LEQQLLCCELFQMPDLPRAIGSEDCVCEDSEFSYASHDGEGMGLSFCDEAIVERDKGGVPTTGRDKGRGEQARAGARPPAACSPLPFCFA
jgi:hypothetical protein